MPEHFRWIGKSSEWVERRRSMHVVGKIHNVSFFVQPDLYHLRLLLYDVNGSTFTINDDLLTFNGTGYSTYKQVCLARGLT